MLQQPPEANFRYQPPVAMRCHDSISKDVWGPLGSVAVPEYASKLHYFQGVDAYCRHSRFASWPTCPPAAAPLSKEDVFFGVLTTRWLLASRARVASRTLALQGARHRIFAEFQMADNSTGYVSALPESAKLETPGSRSPYIAQKVLEMLVVMYRSEARRGARWWVVCDDDSFVFVERLVRVLSMLNASEPLLVGGGRARAPLCGNGLCHHKNWTEQHGHPPSVKHHAGGPAYVLSDAAMRRVVHGLRHQLCFDAPYGDTAVVRALGQWGCDSCCCREGTWSTTPTGRHSSSRASKASLSPTIGSPCGAGFAGLATASAMHGARALASAACSDAQCPSIPK